MANVVPEPFQIHVADEELEDLHRRLRAARIVPNEIEDAGQDPNGAWAYGTDRSVLQAYVRHWLEDFDWRRQAADLNSLPQFTLPVRGLRTHFIHQRSDSASAVPLLLTHGWPGSVVEFRKLLPLLQRRFHVVAPSLPGYGWSEAPRRRGADVGFMAEHLHELMQLLGYRQYAAQGGDWGAIILSELARRFPESCVALHVNMAVAVPQLWDWYGILKILLGLPFISADERDGLRSTLYFMKHETGYQAIQGTKPQSLGYGLNDSPVGLLAWILEKFQSWSDSGSASPEESGLTKDELLTDVMVYWTTQTITSSLRIYYETLRMHPHKDKMPRPAFSGYVAVPTGVLWAKSELFKLPRHMIAQMYNLKHWSPQPKGGHFFAFEQPEAMADDLEQFFCKTIDFEQCKAHPARRGQHRPWEPGKYLLLGAAVAAAATAVSRVRSRL